MIKLSNSKLLQIFTKLLILLALAKAISLLVLWYFPSEGVDISIKENYQPMYQTVNFSNMLAKAQRKKEITKSASSNSKNISITSMILNGLYGTNAGGYVIVAMKSSPKDTSIVGVSEEYQGYVLKSILASSAVFLKQNQEYELSLEDVKKSLSVFKVDNSQNNEDVQHNISRKDIERYTKAPESIWKDISIKELKDKNKIIGFKVTGINPNSKFAYLGLKKGDIIIKVNNVALTSYKVAIDIYKNIDKLESVQIVVIREKQEKELVYEIN
ncbi:PDZ domain-containing protein [Sulfurimonas sp. CS5]|jgi:type II secretion system protein C|uniref:PDZ domain-containing protein n=1 Tax=Sulfurimonas sp. CS5 TaxID=3391145 RepID=UPI0039E873C3